MTVLPDKFSEAIDTVPQDWTALSRYLEGRGIGLGRGRPRQFAGGFGNLNYLVEIDGKPAVLRRPPAGPLPAGANDMAREFRILSSLWRAYPLAPRAILFCEEPHVLGAPFQLIEYRPGLLIRDMLPDELAGRAEVGALLSRQLVEALAALHAIDPAQVDLQTLGRPAGFLARTVEGWTARAAAVADLIDPRVSSEIVRWLRRRVPADAPPSLIHSDFKLDNMILDPETLAPVAVIDWDMGTRGDPLWDLAVMLSYWVEPGDPACLRRVRQMPTAQPGFWRRAEVLAAYLGLTNRVVADFTFYRTLAVFRSGIVFLQLYDRFRREPVPDRRCAHFAALGADLIDYAFEITRGRAE
ncbi:MAG: phosphotransferase family protein [Alphaproteobacteria bacterium]|nr:phosphotransferase family protein [Alphaproteobacteria bacterium]